MAASINAIGLAGVLDLIGAEPATVPALTTVCAAGCMNMDSEQYARMPSISAVVLESSVPVGYSEFCAAAEKVLPEGAFTHLRLGGDGPSTQQALRAYALRAYWDMPQMAPVRAEGLAQVFLSMGACGAGFDVALLRRMYEYGLRELCPPDIIRWVNAGAELGNRARAASLLGLIAVAARTHFGPTNGQDANGNSYPGFIRMCMGGLLMPVCRVPRGHAEFVLHALFPLLRAGADITDATTTHIVSVSADMLARSAHADDVNGERALSRSMLCQLMLVAGETCITSAFSRAGHYVTCLAATCAATPWAERLVSTLERGTGLETSRERAVLVTALISMTRTRDDLDGAAAVMDVLDAHYAGDIAATNPALLMALAPNLGQLLPRTGPAGPGNLADVDQRVVRLLRAAMSYAEVLDVEVLIDVYVASSDVAAVQHVCAAGRALYGLDVALKRDALVRVPLDNFIRVCVDHGIGMLGHTTKAGPLPMRASVDAEMAALIVLYAHWWLGGPGCCTLADIERAVDRTGLCAPLSVPGMASALRATIVYHAGRVFRQMRVRSGDPMECVAMWAQSM